MIDKPTISVVLPVYNGEKYLAEAIESVLTQTFEDFELIIINDGSKDNSLSIIKRYMSQDKRIKLIDRENKGLVYSLNEGVSQARGLFIARMDADDICLPARFEEQINYMQTHKLDLCGSWIQPFTEDKMLPIRKHPESHEDITIAMIFFNCLAHPSMMIKSNIFTNLNYDNEVAEDYQLWCRAILRGYRVGNTPKVLLMYRVHAQQITKNKLEELILSTNNISNSFANQLGPKERKIVKYKTDFIYSHSRELYTAISHELSLLANKYNISKDTIYSIHLWLYNKAQPKTPWLYYKYRKLTSDHKKEYSNELELFLKSLIYLHPESTFFLKLKHVYHKALDIRSKLNF